MAENQNEAQREATENQSAENQPNLEGEAQPERTNYQPIREAIERELEQLDRSSFRRILADYLGYAPTPKAIAKLAEKQPDRWIQGLTMLAQLAGFKRDSIEINNNTLIVQQMSDSELQRRLAAAQQAQLEARQTQVIQNVPRGTPEREHERELENIHQPRPTSYVNPSRDINVVDVVANVVDNPVEDAALHQANDDVPANENDSH